MRALDRWSHDPVVRGLVSTGNAAAAVFLLIAWYGKAVVSTNVWPMAFVLALLPLRGDVHQRFWDYARTEWLHASGFVSRARLATACAVQEAFEAFLRAGVIVLLTVQIRSVPKSASLYSWLTLGCTSWVGMFAAWAGVLLLVRASWSLAVNLDVSRVAVRRGKPAVRRNDASEDAFGPIAWFAVLGWVGVLAFVLRPRLARLRDPSWNAHVRGSVLLRSVLAIAIALPPCALGLWLERAWIPALCGVAVLVLLWRCVYEKEFVTSAAARTDDGEADASATSNSTPIAEQERRSTSLRAERARPGRAVSTSPSARRPALARLLFWQQIDRMSLIGIGVLLILAAGIRWGVGGLPLNEAGAGWWWVLVVALLFVPVRPFRWSSAGEQAEFLHSHGHGFARLRRAELTTGLCVLAVMAALCSLLVAGAPRSWAEWSCLLVASAHALIACNPSPISRRWRVHDLSGTSGWITGIVIVLFMSSPSEPGMQDVGLVFATAGFAIALLLWFFGWWRTFDEEALRSVEARFAERG